MTHHDNCVQGCSVFISHSFTIITVAVLCIDMKQVTPQALPDFHIVEVVHLYHLNKDEMAIHDYIANTFPA